MPIIIEMQEAQIACGELPGVPGGKIVIFQDLNTGIKVSVPLDPKAAKALGGRLVSTVLVATSPLLPDALEPPPS